MLYAGHRYPPKALIGLAAANLLKSRSDHMTSRVGVGTKCFVFWKGMGSLSLQKDTKIPFRKKEVEDQQTYAEGTLQSLLAKLLRYERDPKAREKCVRHYGVRCQVCGFDFAEVYGAIGRWFYTRSSYRAAASHTEKLCR